MSRELIGWVCHRCGHRMYDSSHPRWCPNCAYTVYDPIHEYPLPSAVSVNSPQPDTTECYECETTGYNCLAHQQRPPVSSERYVDEIRTEWQTTQRDELRQRIVAAISEPIFGMKGRDLGPHLTHLALTAADAVLAVRDEEMAWYKRQANALAERAVMWDRVADQMMDRMTDDDDGEEDMGFLIVAFVDRLVARAKAAEARVDAERQRADAAEADLERYKAQMGKYGRTQIRLRTEARQRAEAAEAALHGAYRERARLVAYLASQHHSVLAYNDPSDPDWPVVYVTTPAGQMSWHISPDDVGLFTHAPVASNPTWDGHSTETKYERLAALTAKKSKAGDEWRR